MKEGTIRKNAKIQTLNILFSKEDYEEKRGEKNTTVRILLKTILFQTRQPQQVFPFNEAMNIILLRCFTLVLFQTCIYGPVNTRAFLPFYLFGRSTVEQLAHLFQPACLLTIFHPIINCRDCGGGTGVHATQLRKKKKKPQQLNMILKWQFTIRNKYASVK